MGGKQKRKMILLSLAVLLCLLTGLPAFSADRSTVMLHCKEDGVLLAGLHWKLYRVGHRTGDTYALDGDYAGYPVSFGDMTTEAMSAAASTLKTYTVVDDLPCYAQADTNTHGDLWFSDLEDGLYLLCSSPLTQDGIVYTPASFLLEMDAETQPQITAAPKFTSHPQPPSQLTQQFEVLLFWDNEDDEEWDEDEPILITIYRNGELYDTILLDKGSDWSGGWTDDGDEAEWLVVESFDKESYTYSYTNNQTQFLIVNSFHQRRQPPTEPTGVTEPTGALVPTAPRPVPTSPKTNDPSRPGTDATEPKQPMRPKPKLPQTGQLWWPVPLLTAGGLLFLGIGAAIGRKEDRR